MTSFEPALLATGIIEARARGELVPLISRQVPGVSMDQAAAVQRSALGQARLASPPVYKLTRLPLPDGSGPSPLAVAPFELAQVVEGTQADLPSPHPYRRVIEAEMVVELSAQGQITGYAASLELPLMRIDIKAGPLIQDAMADNLFADRVIIGPICRNFAATDVERIEAVLRVDGEERERAVIGHSDYAALVAQSLEEIAARGWPLVDGTRLTSGSLFAPVLTAEPVEVVADFGALGVISLQSG